MKKPHKERKAIKEPFKRQDIIVTRVTYEEEPLNANEKIIRRKEKKVNLTKKINETKKMIKQETALDKIEKAEKEMLNKGVY